ncbi:MAG: acyl-CoA dehydrogenase family protein [Ktedonobacterales bacterium]|nr:acyl-CoA dehydrogenase family protein [Ktedonobacterales bacterium]
MDFAYTARMQELRQQVGGFMDAHIFPNEQRYHEQIAAAGNPFAHPAIVDELAAQARTLGLWNLFLPESPLGAGLSNLEYAPLAELMGRVVWASEVFNCNAPDTGNMEILAQFGTPEQQARWLQPLLAGEMRSAFCMTEPDVASSDATRIQLTIQREGDDYVLNGRKWWASGALRPRCAIFIVMGKTAPDSPDAHRQQSMVLVPRDTPGVTVVRNLTVMGYEDPESHCEVTFENVRVPISHLLGGEGDGFAIAQARLGPGRIHHCMRCTGAAQRCLELMCQRVTSRIAFGRPLAEQGVIREWIAESEIEIAQARLLTLQAAWTIDQQGKKAAQDMIAMIKVVAPNVLQRVADRAMQAFGGGGMSSDFPLAFLWTQGRTLRLADGPDEVHKRSIAKSALRRYAK